jgi:DNA polymerase III subunit delta
MGVSRTRGMDMPRLRQRAQHKAQQHCPEKAVQRVSAWQGSQGHRVWSSARTITSTDHVLQVQFRYYGAMKISLDSLAAQLKKNLPVIALVTGDEPLLLGEACDALRSSARERGFTERQVFFVQRGFDWNELRAATQALSLFADQRVIEVRLSGASPGNEGSEVLCEIAAQNANDLMVLVVTDKLDAKSLGTKWVTAIEKSGWLIQVWPIETAQLPAWVGRRLQRAGFKTETGVAELIAERVEGNLLAAQQEIDKLALLYPNSTLTVEQTLDAVADSARYDVLQLGIAALQANAARALRILEGLQEEGIDAVLVLWGINKDLQWLARVSHAMSRGQAADAALFSAGVWKPRQAAMKQAAQRMKLPAVRALLVDAAQVDAAIKGVNRRDPWVELRGVVARLAGVKLARAKVA